VPPSPLESPAQTKSRRGKLQRQISRLEKARGGQHPIPPLQKKLSLLVEPTKQNQQDDLGVKAAVTAAVACCFADRYEIYFDDVLEKYNMCCVCLDPYEVDPDLPSERRLPIKGACGHDLCEPCLDAYFAQSLSGKHNIRYIKCPLCKKKAFDIQNKVTDHLLCDLLKARALKTISSRPGTDDTDQISSEVAMLRKKNEEAEKEMTRLMKRNEELEKVASENAQLRRRIEELEACSVGNGGL